MAVTRLLIANRGEIAVRIARTCRSMGIATVAVYSDPDAGALHVEVCDEAARLPGAAPADTYLRGDLLVAAAARAGADAVHPGYGFLAENADFARQVQAAGLTWVGPAPDVIAAMGDKLEAKRRLAEVGVPVLPSADVAGHADDDALPTAGEAVGYPLLVKATAGGGGTGMRIVRHPDDLADAVASARRESAGAFGDDRVFLERLVERPRHIEVQVVGDLHGNVVHVFERECSIQRRHQKVIEESPSPGIDDEVRAALLDTALAAAKSIGYSSAGTVEFVVDEAVLARRRAAAGRDTHPRDAFAFLEVNTRLQVEHPVTEEVVRVRNPATGVLERLDLVRAQLLVAAGERLPFAQDDLVPSGHAIEARLYAEDPATGYLPATGTLHAFQPASPSPGVRWDTGVREGDEIGPHYDPLLAKVVAHGPTRAEAAARLAQELDETWLHGVPTNRDLLIAVLRDERFVAGDTTTAFLDERFPDPARDLEAPSPAAVDIALCAAVLHAAARRRRAAPVLASLPSGWSNTRVFDPEVAFVVAGEERRVGYRRDRAGAWQLHLDVAPDAAPDAAAALDVVVHAADDDTIDLEVEGRRLRCTVLADGGDGLQVTSALGRVVLQTTPRFPEPTEAAVPGATIAPMPGSVVRVAVAEGDRVAEGALLVVVEAMKMEHRIVAPATGTVASVRVATGSRVAAGDLLVLIDADGHRDR